MFKVGVQVRANRRGIMLHELLFVIVVLSLLVAWLAWSMFLRYHRTPYRVSVKSQVSMLEDAVNHYVLSVGSAPTQQQGLDALLVPPADLADPTKWDGPYLDKVQLPVDPWNNGYQYKALGKSEFLIRSNGPDGVSGTKDDISSKR
jgi:general secretion pathway protein G